MQRPWEARVWRGVSEGQLKGRGAGVQAARGETGLSWGGELGAGQILRTFQMVVRNLDCVLRVMEALEAF